VQILEDPIPPPGLMDGCDPGFDFFDERVLNGNWQKQVSRGVGFSCAALHARTHARTSGAIPPPLLQPKSESEAIREFFTSLALNHTVLVEVDEKDPSIRKYNGASPDEEALVIAAKNVGFKFLEKDKSALGETMKVEVGGYGEVSSRLCFV
jgi:magnesium-transporting ATPase (P-type)